MASHPRSTKPLMVGVIVLLTAVAAPQTGDSIVSFPSISRISPGLRSQPANTGTVEDIDGNVYQSVRIGNQWWMAENLRVTHDPQGQSIESLIYDNSQANEELYGRLYSWNVAMNGASEEGTRGIAPEGWHIPDDADWQELFEFLGGVSVAGGKMKEAGTEHWDPPNRGAVNTSGITGLPAGGFSSGRFEGLGIGTHFWSSTQQGSSAAIPTLHTSSESVLLFVISKAFYHSVRCVRDTPVPVRETSWSRFKGAFRGVSSSDSSAP